MNKVNDLVKDIIEEQDVTADLLDSLYAAVSAEVEFNEVKLISDFWFV